MGRISLPRVFRTAGQRRTDAVASTVLAVAIGIASSSGCGQGPKEASNSTEGAVASTGDNSGFRLPPDFKPVDIPVDTRKQVFKEAHEIRALAVQEANVELPMDEASLPVGNTAAFEKRIADHKAINKRIVDKNLPTLAEKYKITVADIEKIEDEANRLRWVPPLDPVLETKPPAADSKAKQEDDPKTEKKGESEPKTSKTK